MNKLPREICGIYYLYLGEEIVYIGMSWNIFARVGDHATNCVEFDQWSYELIERDKLRAAEREAIKKHRPRFNKLVRRNWQAEQKAMREASKLATKNSLK